MSDPPELRTRTLVLVVAMASLALISWSTIADNVPSARSPHSFAVVIPLFAGGTPFAVTVLPLLFLLWSVNLVAGHIELPTRSIVLLLFMSLGCAIWIAQGWRYGPQFQGLGLTVLWTLANAAIITLMWILARRFGSNPSWRKTLLFHWLLFAWAAWCAFPWLGELI